MKYRIKVLRQTIAGHTIETYRPQKKKFGIWWEIYHDGELGFVPYYWMSKETALQIIEANRSLKTKSTTIELID